MSDTIDQFVDVNKRLFKICDERTALDHIQSIKNQDAKAMAEMLWKIEQIERKIATKQS